MSKHPTGYWDLFCYFHIFNNTLLLNYSDFPHYFYFLLEDLKVFFSTLLKHSGPGLEAETALPTKLTFSTLSMVTSASLSEPCIVTDFSVISWKTNFNVVKILFGWIFNIVFQVSSYLQVI